MASEIIATDRDAARGACMWKHCCSTDAGLDGCCTKIAQLIADERERCAQMVDIHAEILHRPHRGLAERLAAMMRGKPKVISAFGITGDIQQQRLKIAREAGEVGEGRAAFPCQGCGMALTGGDDTLCGVDANENVFPGFWCRPCAKQRGLTEVDA